MDQCSADFVLTQGLQSASVSYLPTADLPPIVNRKRGRLPHSVTKLRPRADGSSNEQAIEQSAQRAAYAARIRTPAEIMDSLQAHLDAAVSIACARFAEFLDNEASRTKP